MTIKVGVGGAWKSVPLVKVGVGGAWKIVTRAWIGVGGVWKELYSALAVDYPATVTSAGSGAAPSGDTPATQVGVPSYTSGSGSYTYSWAKTSGHVDVGISNSTIERPYFSASDVTTIKSAVFTVTVTDTVTGATAQDTVTVNCTWTDTT